MLDEKSWLANSVYLPIYPKGGWWGWGQGFVRATQVLPQQTYPAKSLWTLLCALGHAGIEKSLPHTVPQSWKHSIVQNVLVCWCIKTYLHCKQGEPLKNSPIPLYLLLQTLQLAQYRQAGNIHLASPKLPYSAKQRSVIRHFTKHVSTAPESSGCLLYTPPSAGIVLGDVRFACICSAMFLNAFTFQ